MALRVSALAGLMGGVLAVLAVLTAPVAGAGRYQEARPVPGPPGVGTAPRTLRVQDAAPTTQDAALPTQEPGSVDDEESVDDNPPSASSGDAAPSGALMADDPRANEDAIDLSQRARRLIQFGLVAAGFDPGPRDGVFGDRTRAAVRSWQASRGQTPTGYLDVPAATDLQRAGVLQERLEATRGELQETRQERDAAQREVEGAAQAAQQAERETTRAQEQAAADRAQYVRWIAIVAATASAAGLVFWIISHRAAARAAQERARAEAARSDLAKREERDRLAADVPAVLLDGEDEGGEPVALRIPGRAIAAEEGVVVGRNPFDSGVMLDHPAVSRRHFRLFTQGTSVMVEDLNSTNGVTLNDARLEPGASALLEDGAVLGVGSLAFHVTLQA